MSEEEKNQVVSVTTETETQPDVAKEASSQIDRWHYDALEYDFGHSFQQLW